MKGIIIQAAVLLALLSNIISLSSGFQLSPGFLFSSRENKAVVSLKAAGDDRYEERQAHNDARVCVKNFLTQRAIQSFMFLLVECRDPHTGKWIEDFLDVKSLLNYHGTGAFNISRFESWEAVLLDMAEMPKDEVIVSAKRRGRGHGGWSKNNPYLEERYVEFTIDIDPASLVTRILSVRGQIANEFLHDLDILVSANEQILDSYFSNVKNKGRDDTNPEELASTFDRMTSAILGGIMESVEVASSPLRKGNFDLLYNLCTQASVHQLLRDIRQQKDDAVNFEWLLEFYGDRVKNFFDGDQTYGRADDFMEEMLLTSPAVKDLGNGNIGLIDPLGMAERIITTRTDIALHWKELMEETASDHMQIQKFLLAKRMGNPVDELERGLREDLAAPDNEGYFE